MTHHKSKHFEYQEGGNENITSCVFIYPASLSDNRYSLLRIPLQTKTLRSKNNAFGRRVHPMDTWSLPKRQWNLLFIFVYFLPNHNVTFYLNVLQRLVLLNTGRLSDPR